MGITDLGHPDTIEASGTDYSDGFNVQDEDGSATLYWRTSGDGTIEVTLQASLDEGANWFDLETIDGQTFKKQSVSGALSNRNKYTDLQVGMLRLKFQETQGSDPTQLEDVKAAY